MGLVVLATGLGKTWLSAFDTVPFGARRVLFVAHREEILKQALATFRAIRPEATLGLYTGAEKAPESEVLFASIQTLGKAEHLRRFSPRSFDYIIIDEFHHASARTYRRLIDYFEPEFILGLTATPERTDGGDLLALCGENLVPFQTPAKLRHNSRMAMFYTYVLLSVRDGHFYTGSTSDLRRT